MKEIIHKHHFLLKSLRTYIILLVVVIVSSTPLYVQTFNISKKSVLDNTEHNIRLGLRMLENEINMHESIIQKLIVSP